MKLKDIKFEYLKVGMRFIDKESKVEYYITKIHGETIYLKFGHGPTFNIPFYDAITNTSLENDELIVECEGLEL